MNTFISNSFYLPPFPDGELVNHFLERVCLFSGKASLRSINEQLFERCQPLVDSMPNDLQSFHREIGYLYCSIDVLLDRHSHCDFHCCGLPQTRFEAQRERLKRRMRGSIRLTHLPVMFASNERANLRCPECAKVQEMEFGFPYTHRQTEVPFVSICGIHGNVLKNAAGKLRLYDAQCRCAPTSLQMTMEREYARRVAEAVETPVAISPYQKEVVAERLRQQGWMSQDGRFRYEDFVAEFSLFFKGAFSDVRLALLVEQREYIESAVIGLLRRDRNVHPVWCVLLLWFAENCAFDKRLLLKVRAGAVETLSKEAIEHTLSVEGTIPAAAKVLKVDAARLSLRCKQLGIQRSWRPHFITDELVAALNVAFDSGMTTRAIVEQFRVSRTTVQRFKANRAQELNHVSLKATVELESAKIDWEQARRLNPHLRTCGLRRRYPIIWSTLRRDAPDWLREHQGLDSATPVEHRRKLPEQLLAPLSVAMEEAGRAFSVHAAGPRKASSYRLRKLTGVTHYMQRYCRSSR
ncbi:hypothetical protein [Paraburkholderia bannensis]|uniref:hypothetical protein n=1 Tax=Paraburkholderia bannensis TaxID=765414 RepID=UPI002AB7C524|nr:hypothetical protein [Paraburkholderia bannensis]